MKKILSFLLIILSALLIFSGCATNNPTDNTNETIGYADTTEDTFTVDTKYCPLHYPTKWEEYTDVEILTEPYYSVSFNAILDDSSKIPVFEVVFGDNKTGVLLGTINFENENINIYLIDNSDNWPSDLNSNETERLNMMSEDVNIMISKLVYESQMSVK